MLDDFRSRMDDLRQEMDRLTNQAEEMERVVREQQEQLEEQELLIRQRDEQLAEQQSRIEELEASLKESQTAAEELREQIEEREQTLAQREKELEDLRSQLAQREATETLLREQLAQTEMELSEQPAVEKTVDESILTRFNLLEDLVRNQSQVLTQLHNLVQEEMTRLHERLKGLEGQVAQLSTAVEAPPPTIEAEVTPAEEAVVPTDVVVPTEAEVAVPVEVEEVAAPVEAEEDEVTPIEVEEVVAPVEVEAEEVTPVAVEEEEVTPVAVEPEKVAPVAVEEEVTPVAVEVPPEDPLLAILHNSLSMMPNAELIGIASRAGIGVETVARGEESPNELLEVELAELAVDAQQIAAALESSPLLTVGFVSGERQYLLSPVDESYFAFLVAPAEMLNDIRRTQAVLLQAATRLRELV